MKNKECTRRRYLLSLLSVLLVATLALAGCSNPEKNKAEHVTRGEAFLAEKKFQEASIEFRNAIQIDDNLAPAHWGLAQAYLGLGRGNEAVDEIRRTIDLDANNLEARVTLANLYLNSSRASEAVAEAERLAKDVLEKDPNHIEGHILMATVLYAQDSAHPEKALAELNRAIEINPQRVESHLSLARFYVVLKDVGKAEETFRRALAVNDRSALAHTEFGKFLVQTNRPDAAEAEFKRAVEVDPNDHDARFVLASFYLVNKQLDKAEEAYKALANLEPGKPDGRAVLGDFYSSIGRYDDAVRVYREILASSPDFVRGRYRLGEIMLQHGDTAGATEQVEAVLKTNERDMQALLLRARIRMQTGQPQEIKAAIEDLKEVLKQEPNSRAGLYFIAQASLAVGQTDQARAYAGDLEKYYPDYLPAKLIQVQVNFSAGDPKTAQRLANELLARLDKAQPDNFTSPQLLAELRQKALTSRGLAQLLLKNTQAARQDLTAARDLAPNLAASYINLARVSLQENKLDEGIGFFNRALEIDNANFDALNGLLTAYAAQRKTDQAHARLDQAINAAQSAQPNNKQLNASLHYLKAQIYGYEKNAEGTEAELRRALEIDPNYLAAYSSLGGLFVNLKQQDRAIAEYRKIIERTPDNAPAYTLIGILEDSRQNHDAAAENYRKALEYDPNAVIAANNLAWNYAVYTNGNLDEAIRLAQGVVQKFPEEAGFVDTLGWVYYKKNLFPAAVEQLQKVVAKQGNSPTYRYHLGMALIGQGDKAGGRRELEQALRLAQSQNIAFAEADEARSALASL